jgi:hypothetical protein
MHKHVLKHYSVLNYLYTTVITYTTIICTRLINNTILSNGKVSPECFLSSIELPRPYEEYGTNVPSLLQSHSAEIFDNVFKSASTSVLDVHLAISSCSESGEKGFFFTILQVFIGQARLDTFYITNVNKIHPILFYSSFTENLTRNHFTLFVRW